MPQPQGSAADARRPSRSSPVKTASTPGIASAARCVDRLDGRMRMRRAHEHAHGHVGPLDVGDVVAAAGEEAPVFLAERSSADADDV